jgi:hypothetical protein
MSEVYTTFQGTTWFIEGDISACFDRFDHQVLRAILAEKIHDNRFLRLIGNLLRAGYLEDWRFHETLSGTPQGGVLSPVLANIYLSRLDRFVETVLVPAHTRGEVRRLNPRYGALRTRAYKARRAGRWEAARTLKQQMQRLPSVDPHDDSYRRLRYVRYADDFLLGFVGPRHEAEAIKGELRDFLRDTLKLELSEAKTLITHARTEKAHFLGYEVNQCRVQHRRAVPGRVPRRGAVLRAGPQPPHPQPTPLGHGAVARQVGHRLDSSAPSTKVSRSVRASIPVEQSSLSRAVTATSAVHPHCHGSSAGRFRTRSLSEPAWLPIRQTKCGSAYASSSCRGLHRSS